MTFSFQCIWIWYYRCSNIMCDICHIFSNALKRERTIKYKIKNQRSIYKYESDDNFKNCIQEYYWLVSMSISVDYCEERILVRRIFILKSLIWSTNLKLLILMLYQIDSQIPKTLTKKHFIFVTFLQDIVYFVILLSLTSIISKFCLSERHDEIILNVISYKLVLFYKIIKESNIFLKLWLSLINTLLLELHE